MDGVEMRDERWGGGRWEVGEMRGGWCYYYNELLQKMDFDKTLRTKVSVAGLYFVAF